MAAPPHACTLHTPKAGRRPLPTLRGGGSLSLALSLYVSMYGPREQRGIGSTVLEYSRVESIEAYYPPPLFGASRKRHKQGESSSEGSEERAKGGIRARESLLSPSVLTYTVYARTDSQNPTVLYYYYVVLYSYCTV